MTGKVQKCLIGAPNHVFEFFLLLFFKITSQMIFCLRPERWVELGKAARTENNIIKNIAVSINWQKKNMI